MSCKRRNGKAVAQISGRRYGLFGLASFAVALAFQPDSLRACAACYGQSDAPMAAGMNWGIFSLLTVVVFVLGGVAAFFVYLARRAATVAATDPETERRAHLASTDTGSFALAGRAVFRGSATGCAQWPKRLRLCIGGAQRTTRPTRCAPGRLLN